MLQHHNVQITMVSLGAMRLAVHFDTLTGAAPVSCLTNARTAPQHSAAKLYPTREWIRHGNTSLGGRNALRPPLSKAHARITHKPYGPLA